MTDLERQTWCKKVSDVFGVIFELTNDQIRNLDRIEGEGYRRESIIVDSKGEKIEVATYFATENYVQENLLPTKQYLGYLIDGAKEHRFPEDYISFLENIPHL